MKSEFVFIFKGIFALTVILGVVVGAVTELVRYELTELNCENALSESEALRSESVGVRGQIRSDQRRFGQFRSE